MTLSMKIVLEILNDKDVDVTHHLGFIITVIRDNTTDDHTFKVLDMLSNRLWEENYR